MQEYSKCKDFVKHLWFVAIGLVGFIFYHQQGIQLESRMVYLYIYIHIHIYIHMHMHMHMHMHVYHVYMYKASPLQIGTHAAIILCAWILQNSPKFLLKSCSIGTWTQTPTCVYMYAACCIYIYIYIGIFFHVHACTWCTWYIHIIININIYTLFLHANTVLFFR